MVEKEFFTILRPLRKRMHANKGLYWLFALLTAAGAAGVFLSYAALWFPVPFLTCFIFRIYFTGMAVGIVISIFLPPGMKSLIKTADSLGLKERVITAWQLREDESRIAMLQREDARQAVLNADFKRLYPVRFPVKLAIAFAATVLLILASFSISGFARDEARMAERLKSEVSKQSGSFKKVTEELKKNDSLTEKELEKILEEIKALETELKKARNEEDALKALSRTENELNKLDMQRQLNQLGKALSSSDTTKGLGESLQNENMMDMKQALEQLQRQLEKEEISRRELAEMLEEAGRQLENEEISEKLQQAAEQIASADNGSASNAMQNLSDALSAMMQQGGTGFGKALQKFSKLMQQAKAAVSQVDNRTGTGTKTARAQDSKQDKNQQGSQGNEKQESEYISGGQQAMQGSSENGGQNGSSGEGGGQSGEGTGQSANSGGDGGAGEGSTNEDAGYTGGEIPGGGRKPGERKEEDYERLYDPDRLGGSNKSDMVSGQKQNDGQSQYTQVDNMPVQKGEVLPYREVLARYRDEAVSYMEDTMIPAAMKQIVREYFESLE